jgi:hypothetical protein
LFVTTLSYHSARARHSFLTPLRGLAATGLALALGTAASATPSLGPSLDELWNTAVADRAYTPQMSAPSWIAPGPGLPPGVDLQPSNNNVALASHGGRVFLAWRSSRTHFASRDSRLYVVSTATPGKGWTMEAAVALGRDVREPFLLSVGPRLFLYFAELGADAARFEPGALWRMERSARDACG